MKRKQMLKRMGLELLQHAMVIAVTVAAAGLLLNSYVSVDSINGKQIYRIFPKDSELEFEESEIYHDLFRNAVSDITQLVAIKEQLETDDELDPLKKIDVTEYARRIGEDQNCDVSVVYELDDLIKWGKYGVEYGNRMRSLSEFIHYYGNCLFPENFMLDEYEQLVFDDFYRVEREEGPLLNEGEAGSDSNSYNSTGETSSFSGKSQEEIDKLSDILKNYPQEQLEDMVLSHIMGKSPGSIQMSREDDGGLTVAIPMLNCRYATVDGKRQLTDYVNNWVDFLQLQHNVAASIENLITNYQRYQLCNDAYREGRSNVKYMIRMMTDNGICTYTNIPQLKNYEDIEVTEYFSEYRRYLIYYPDSLEFMGNTILSQEELDGYISVYDYAYPDTTHIWLGVDSAYTIEGDAFYTANEVYQKIVPNVNRILAGIGLMILIWLGLGLYLTITAGAAAGSEHAAGHLNRFDRIWTELLILLGAGLTYGAMYGFREIMEITQNALTSMPEVTEIQGTRLYQYGMFALYGFYVSLSVNLVWYSLVRRVKAENLWKDSFIKSVCRVFSSAVRFLLHHKNSAISILLPYNMFLFLNLLGVTVIYKAWGEWGHVFLVLTALILLDGLVGVLMFRHGAERNTIVEGINRIRDGEVDYKLNSGSLHGTSRELAEAVNNIGEGIGKAVRTSMKDEQMKTDLITNVSHDIKTPLTSIINYIDLLKRMKIEQEPAKSYIEILDGKAQRLKQLTDDLVEVSKISSGNIVLNREKLNLTELLNQGIGEFSERMKECRLQVIFEGKDQPACIFADSSRMWRVVENLFHNICKYAMEGTRVYIDVIKHDGRVEAAIKNISSQQMNIRPEELTERFFRGDSSRTTEGSGLGLSIAKSLVQVQGGNFEIFLDGDLFKVVISFLEEN